MIIIFFLLLINVPSADAAEVLAYRVEKKTINSAIEALGTLRAKEFVNLTASVSDTITHIHFEDGQRVEKGYVLAQMTNDEESALVSEMTARVAEAKRQFERLRQLPDSGAVSKSLFDERERQYEAARAQLEAMRSRLQDRLIVAPFAGVVGLRTISIGALVEPGDVITTLTDDSQMKLDCTVPSLFLSALKPGMSIEARAEAFPGQEFIGKLSAINSRVDPVTRSITVRALLENPGRMLKPGLLMSATLLHQERKALVLPEEALLSTGPDHHVLILREQETGDTFLVEKAPVHIGVRQRGIVEVRSGLEEGQLVMTHGHMVAAAGDVVSLKGLQKLQQTSSELIQR